MTSLSNKEEFVVKKINSESKNEKSRSKVASAFRRDPGGDLLSHTKNHAVPSALKSLTTEFGMGSGVTSSLRPPGIMFNHLS